MSDVVVLAVCQNPGCGGELKHRPTEAAVDFKKRKFCSRSCKTTVQMSRAKPVPSNKRSVETINYLVSEVRHLIGTDSSEGVAKRLGMKYGSLERILRDAGEYELAIRFASFSFDRPEPCPICLRMVKPSNLDAHQETRGCKSDGWRR